MSTHAPVLIIPCLASVTLRLDLKRLWRGFEGAKEEEKWTLERNHISPFSVLSIHWEAIHTDPPASLPSLRPHLNAWEEIVAPGSVLLVAALKGNKPGSRESVRCTGCLSYPRWGSWWVKDLPLHLSDRSASWPPILFCCFRYSVLCYGCVIDLLVLYLCVVFALYIFVSVLFDVLSVGNDSFL